MNFPWYIELAHSFWAIMEFAIHISPLAIFVGMVFIIRKFDWLLEMQEDTYMAIDNLYSMVEDIAHDVLSDNEDEDISEDPDEHIGEDYGKEIN